MERFRALWNQAMQRPWIAKCWQFVKFGIVGVSNTLISLAVYQIALNALGMHYLAANLLGLVISVINAYYWNNRCVFGDGEKNAQLTLRADCHNPRPRNASRARIATTPDSEATAIAPHRASVQA